MIKARIHSFETFGSVDGPGVRYIVFMQGCRMRCRYCHNPDSWKINDGEEYDAQEILSKAVRYRSYWGDEGGITVSGGEPLLQIDFLLEFFKLCKEQGINTVIDSAAGPFTFEKPFFGKFKELMSLTDLFMFDIKHINPQAHKALTQVDNKNILDCIKYCDSQGQDMWIRHVLVPGVTDNEDDLKELGRFVQGLQHVKKVEVLPYHAFAMPKWEILGLNYTLKDVDTPSVEEVDKAHALICGQ